MKQNLHLNKFCTLLLCIALSLSILVVPAFAFTAYDAKTPDEDWSFQYARHLRSNGVLSEDEILNYNSSEPVTAAQAAEMLDRVNYAIDNIDDNIFGGYVSDAGDTAYTDDPLTRAAVAMLIVDIIGSDKMFELNYVPDGLIPDVEESDEYYDAVYSLYRWGILNGVDNQYSFAPDQFVNYGQMLVIADRLLNANIRPTLSAYSEKSTTIRSDSYPMSYENTETGTKIEITCENHSSAVCYVAHITTTDPNCLRTIYGYREWSVIGAKASEVDAWLHPVFLVNGDFRNPIYGAKLGIIRNRQIVNDKTINGIGLDLNGILQEVSGSALDLLNAQIRETFTFGPVLIRDGEVVVKQDENYAPRTFIGQIYHDDGVLEYYIIVADGRQEGYSMGLTNYEMACVLQGKGCDFGYNLDGGGSSIMMFNGEVLNRPSDGWERSDADYIYIK